jgi:hypothetical protein
VPASPVDPLRRLQPDAVDALERAHEVAEGAVPDPATFELCRLLAADIVGDHAATSPRIDGLDARKLAELPEWWRSDAFSPAEHAHLAFTERFVMAVGSLADADVDGLLEHGPPLDVYTFISALYVEEFRMRLGLVSAAVLAGEEASA